LKEFTKIAQDYDRGRSGEDLDFWAGETKVLARLDVHDGPLVVGHAVHVEPAGGADHHVAVAGTGVTAGPRHEALFHHQAAESIEVVDH